MKDQNPSRNPKTPNLFTQLHVLPPPILHRYPRKKRSEPQSKKLSMYSQDDEFPKIHKSKRTSFQSTFFPISDLDQMQKDFFENRSQNEILFSSESAKRTGFCTPKKPPLPLFKTEPKIQYTKDNANRTNITPFLNSPIPSKNKSSTPKMDLPGLVESSCQQIRLQIPPSYCFESQVSSISPFDFGEEPIKESDPAPITVNRNIVSSQPKDLELNLNEVDAMSFEATGEISNAVLNPNDISGCLKPLFPPKKSGKNPKKPKLGLDISFLGSELNDKRLGSFGHCSCACNCDGKSQKSQKWSEKKCHLNLLRPFGSNLKKSKYISNRMKFEKQGQRRRRKLKKCMCANRSLMRKEKNGKASFVSEFFVSNEQKVGKNNFNISNLDFEKVSIKKREIFQNDFTDLFFK